MELASGVDGIVNLPFEPSTYKLQRHPRASDGLYKTHRIHLARESARCSALQHSNIVERNDEAALTCAPQTQESFISRFVVTSTMNLAHRETTTDTISERCPDIAADKTCRSTLDGVPALTDERVAPGLSSRRHIWPSRHVHYDGQHAPTVGSRMARHKGSFKR